VAGRSRLPWIAAGLSVLICLISGLGELRRPLNPDVAWLLYSAERLLRGERLYVDVLEINPPLIVWLNVPVAAISRVLGLPGPRVLWFTMMLVVAASCFVCAALAARLPGPAVRARRWVTLMGLSFVMLPLAGGMFGQREHLSLALILPLLCLTALRATGTGISRAGAIAIGAAGSVGMAIKPHYGVVWLLLIGYRSWAGRSSRRNWYPEDAVVVTIGVLYPISVLLLTPAYVPFVAGTARDYLAYGAHPLSYILVGDTPAWWFYMAIGAWLLIDPPPKSDPLSWVLVVAGYGFLVAVAAQHKGWSYHYYPLNACAFLLVLSTLCVRRRIGAGGAVLRQAVRGIYAILLALFVAVEMIEAAKRVTGALAPREAREVAVRAAVRQQQGARSILVLSSQLRDAFPLVNDTGLSWRGGYPNLWVPLVYYRSNVGPGLPTEYRSIRGMAVPERVAFERVVRDMVLGSPDVLVVESPSLNEQRTRFPGGFDFLTYFAQEPTFAEALRSYRQVAEVSGLLVLRRFDPNAAS
jgi:hypothetical protein